MMGKEKQRKKGIAVVLLLGLALLLQACGGSSTQSAPAEVNYKTEVTETVMEEAAAGASDTALSIYENESGAVNTQEIRDNGRKLIRTVDMNVETEEYDALMPALEEEIGRLEGYIEYKEAYHGSLHGSSNRSAHLTVRIPSDRLGDFISGVRGMGNVTRESESTEDVTLAYVDLDSHKTMLQLQQERLLEMLEQAQTMEDMIALESRLSDVRYQIESMETQLRTYDNLVEYSTVNLYIEEVERYTPEPEETISERIRSGFAENIYRVKTGLQNFFVELIIALPILAVWAVVIIILILLVRLLIKWERKHSKARQERGKTEVQRSQNGPAIPLIKRRNVPQTPEEGKEEKDSE